MPIWASLALYALLLMGITHRAGDKVATRALYIIVLALFGVQFWKFAGMGEWMWLAFAASWWLVTILLVRISGEKNLHMSIGCLMLVGVTLCYLWGRIFSMPFAPDVLPLLWADILGVAAWTIIAGPSIAALVGDIRRTTHLGGSHRRHRAVSGRCLVVSKNKKAEKVG